MYLSIDQHGKISCEFNNTEQDMGKLEIQSSKEASWSDHLARQAMSGKSIAAFCRDEAISVGNFYAWRSKLRDKPAELPVTPGGVTFIDLGAVTSAIAAPAPEHWRPTLGDGFHGQSENRGGRTL